jgi:hypothetical protein
MGVVLRTSALGKDQLKGKLARKFHHNIYLLLRIKLKYLINYYKLAKVIACYDIEYE